jgi:hypothetical protein
MRFVKFIDRIGMDGGLAAWLIIPLGSVVYEVIMRHVFNARQWGYDTAWMLFAAPHRRRGILLRKGISASISFTIFFPTRQMIYDLVCYLVFS